MQGLQLTAGATVLDFGAGTGWFARFLTQLGCRVILLDVSETALEMARELYRRQPVIGDRPEPEFLLFDGRTIPLPDASVDRVLSFHAFHHAPHPAAVLGELARVLKPGGIAGFAEPGPRHSRTPVSQFEMRNYRVVENDVDVHAIWRSAKGVGFRDLQLAVFHAPPFRVPLDEFEDFLAGGPATAPWVTSTRVFLRNARTFFLTKAGDERVDSRRAEGLDCHIHLPAAETTVPAGAAIEIDALVTNTGTSTWLPWTAGHGRRRLRRAPVRRIRERCWSSTRPCRRSAIRRGRSPLARPSRCGSSCQRSARAATSSSWTASPRTSRGSRRSARDRCA